MLSGHWTWGWRMTSIPPTMRSSIIDRKPLLTSRKVICPALSVEAIMFLAKSALFCGNIDYLHSITFGAALWIFNFTMVLLDPMIYVYPRNYYSPFGNKSAFQFNLIYPYQRAQMLLAQSYCSWFINISLPTRIVDTSCRVHNLALKLFRALNFQRFGAWLVDY